MADISKITTLDGTTYNIKDATARATGKVSGVKGNAESTYRTGDVNLTPDNIGAASKSDAYLKGNAIRNKNTSVDQAPVYSTFITNLKTSEVQTGIRAIAGIGNYFYLAHLNSRYTIECNYPNSSYTNLFTNDLSSDCLIPTTDLSTTPFVLTITSETTIDATDVTHLAMFVHRFDNSGALTDYKVELLTTGTNSPSGTYTWQTVYQRTNVSDKINGLTIALNSTSYSYIYFKGVRFTISGATPYNSTNSSGFAYNKIAICALQLLNTRPAFSPANALGALDQAGGNVFGATTFHRGITANVTGNLTGNADTATNASKVNNHTVNTDVPSGAVFTDTLNTAGSTDSSSKLFLIGATSQTDSSQTYSQDTAYVGTDGCLYSNSTKVLTSHQTIKQDGVTGATVNRYGECTVGSTTAAKTVSVTTGTFSLEAGARVSVKFKYANSANNPTLNVNSTGAKNIFHAGSQITTGNAKAMLKGVVEFIYDGTQWHIIGNNDTTYAASLSQLVTTTVPNVTSVGSAPTLGTAISADDITSWSAGSTPTLGTAIPADDITAWTTNTPTAFSVSGEKLSITSGTAASLSYTAKSIPNVTSVGSVPTLEYTSKSIPNVTSVGSAPTLGTAITVATGSLSTNASGATVATGLTNI